jgi:ABC-type Na+ transport system ATPase subunit NatA
MVFGKNLTVVYGENGTGKTGYGRILKSLGFSYDSGTTIHHNVYGKYEPKCADITFTVNGVSKPFRWDGKNKDADLENISVFNTNCVQVSLADRTLIVLPIGFHLFNLIGAELQELDKLLRFEVMKYPVTIDWAETLHTGTPQQIFIATLSARSSEEILTQLSAFATEHQTELLDKELELSRLNKTLLENEVQQYSAQLNELNNMIEQMELAKKIISVPIQNQIVEIHEQITTLEGNAQSGLKEIAAANKIEFGNSKEFRAFLEAADNYIKLLDQTDYPRHDDLCVYCKQPLNAAAIDLLGSYKNLLHDQTQETLKRINQNFIALAKQVEQVNEKILFHQTTFGIEEDGKPAQPDAISTYNNEIAVEKLKIMDRQKISSPLSIDHDKYILFLTMKKLSLDEQIVQKRKLLTTLSTTEAGLQKVIDSLKDRKFLSSKIVETKKILGNYQIAEILKANSPAFNTRPISTRTTEARDLMIKNNFTERFLGEMKSLRKSNLSIQLTFGTERGNSKISQKTGAHALAEVLSEGEQKAIALAEFLTELQMDNIKAPVIFDDPMNSLDHRIMDAVVARLLKLSKERQVIVFTHSILFFNCLRQQQELGTNKSIDIKFYGVKNNFEETGILHDPEELNPLKYCIGEINKILHNRPTDANEDLLAKRGYALLRAAIEILLEEKIFKKTIMRYKKNIAFTSFLKIDGAKFDAHKDRINEIFDKCCSSIEAHSSPESVHVIPTLSELKTDFTAFLEIDKQFGN